MGSYIQSVKVTYTTDPKTGKKIKVAEETGPMEEYKQEDISAKEFNNDVTKEAKALAAAAKAAAAKAALKKNGGEPTSGRAIVNKNEKPMAGRGIVNKGMS